MSGHCDVNAGSCGSLHLSNSTATASAHPCYSIGVLVKEHDFPLLFGIFLGWNEMFSYEVKAQHLMK